MATSSVRGFGRNGRVVAKESNLIAGARTSPPFCYVAHVKKHFSHAVELTLSWVFGARSVPLAVHGDLGFFRAHPPTKGHGLYVTPGVRVEVASLWEDLCEDGASPTWATLPNLGS